MDFRPQFDSRCCIYEVGCVVLSNRRRRTRAESAGGYGRLPGRHSDHLRCPGAALDQLNGEHDLQVLARPVPGKRAPTAAIAFGSIVISDAASVPRPVSPAMPIKNPGYYCVIPVGLAVRPQEQGPRQPGAFFSKQDDNNMLRPGSVYANGISVT